MDERRLRQLLDDVASGQLGVQAALDQLRAMPFEDLGFAKIDHHRALRTGFPEVIFCPGKTPEQVSRIAAAMREQDQVVLATHASPQIYQAVQAVASEAVYHEQAQIVQVGQPKAVQSDGGSVLVVSAGTSDIPVAEEARVTVAAAGCQVQSLYDVGVAGLHRLDNRSRRNGGGAAERGRRAGQRTGNRCPHQHWLRGQLRGTVRVAGYA